MRVDDLCYYGHSSSVWGEANPLEKNNIVEILASYYVSKPCWKEICEAADHIDATRLDLNEFDDWESETDYVEVHQFFFFSLDKAKKMALRVQSSARNIRKDERRRARLEKAGGFHTKEVLDQLFKIQEGRCYYSGDPLIESPKNFVVDHIDPIYKGGTNWPKNLALTIREINTWKGAHASYAETLNWLAKQRGSSWLRKQRSYCEEVDRLREELDLEFRRQTQ